MKSTIIPSLLEQDTVYAINHAAREGSPIVLLFLHEAPDDVSALAALRSMSFYCTQNQKEVLAECRKAAAAKNAALQVHNQYGLTKPLLRNLMEHLDAAYVALPPSFAASKARVHRQFMTLLQHTQVEVIHAPAEPPAEARKDTAGNLPAQEELITH